MKRIQVHQLGKQYYRYNRLSASPKIREALLQLGRNLLPRRKSDDEEQQFWAVHDVSFSVNEGDAVAVLGRNGAGKTTLLRMLTEVTEPTQGRIELCGRVGYLLGASTGFHEELTGRENVLLVAAMMGFDRISINQAFDEIVDFAEARPFLDMPVKHYSTGMLMKLGFSLAVHLLPDILILDEVLSVGDLAFQQKAIARTREVATSQRTILFVSHNLDAVSRLCNRALILERGRCLFYGDVEEGLRRYSQHLEKTRKLGLQESGQRRGRGRVRLADISLNGDQQASLRPLADGLLQIDLEFSAESPPEQLDIAVDVTTLAGHVLFTLGTHLDPGFNARRQRYGRVSCDLNQLPLAAGIYEMNVRLDAPEGLEDLAENCHQFRVMSDLRNGRPSTQITELGRVVPAQEWSYSELGENSFTAGEKD